MISLAMFLILSPLFLRVHSESVFPNDMDVPMLLVPKSCNNIKHCPKGSTCIQGICFWNACITPDREKPLHYNDLHRNSMKPKKILGLNNRHHEPCHPECHFPFEYNGKLHHSCIQEKDSHFFWCSKTLKYTGIKTQCNQECEDMKDARLPRIEDYFYIPDNYDDDDDDMREDQSQNMKKSGIPEEEYKNKKSIHSKHKSTTTPPEVPTTTQMRSDTPRASSLVHKNTESIANVRRCNPYCVFPFEYYGKIYSGCIKMSGSEEYWCSFTSVYIGIDIPCDIKCQNKDSLTKNDTKFGNGTSHSSLSTPMTTLNRHRNKEIGNEFPSFKVDNSSDLDTGSINTEIPPKEDVSNATNIVHPQSDHKAEETLSLTTVNYQDLTSLSSNGRSSNVPTTNYIKDNLSSVLFHSGSTSDQDNEKDTTESSIDVESPNENLKGTLTTGNPQNMSNRPSSDSLTGNDLKLFASTKEPIKEEAINEVDSTVASIDRGLTSYLSTNDSNSNSQKITHDITTPSNSVQNQERDISETPTLPNSESLISKNKSESSIINAPFRDLQNNESSILGSKEVNIQNTTPNPGQEITKSSSSQKDDQENNQRQDSSNDIVVTSTTLLNTGGINNKIHGISEHESNPSLKTTPITPLDGFTTTVNLKTIEDQNPSKRRTNSVINNNSEDEQGAHDDNILETSDPFVPRNQMNNAENKTISPIMESSFRTLPNVSSSLFNSKNIQTEDTTPKFELKSSSQINDSDMDPRQNNIHGISEHEENPSLKTTSISPLDGSTTVNLKIMEAQSKPQSMTTSAIRNNLDVDKGTLDDNILGTSDPFVPRNQMNNAESKTISSIMDSSLSTLPTDSSSLSNSKNIQIENTTPKFEIKSSSQINDKELDQEKKISLPKKETESSIRDSFENQSSTVPNSGNINTKNSEKIMTTSSVKDNLAMKNRSNQKTSSTPFLQNQSKNPSTLSFQSKFGGSLGDVPFRLLQNQGSTTLFNLNSRNIVSTTPKEDAKNMKSNIDPQNGTGYEATDSSIRDSKENDAPLNNNKSPVEKIIRPCDRKKSETTPFLSSTTFVNPLNSQLFTLNEKFSTHSFQNTINSEETTTVPVSLSTVLPSSDKKIQSIKESLTQTSTEKENIKSSQKVTKSLPTPKEPKERAKSFRSGHMKFDNIMWLDELLGSDDNEDTTTPASTIFTRKEGPETGSVTVSTTPEVPQEEFAEMSTQPSTSMARNKFTASESTTTRFETKRKYHSKHTTPIPSDNDASTKKEMTEDTSRSTTPSSIITTESTIGITAPLELIMSLINSTHYKSYIRNALARKNKEFINDEESTTLSTPTEENLHDSFSTTQNFDDLQFEITGVPTTPLSLHLKTSTTAKNKKLTTKQKDKSVTPQKLLLTTHQVSTKKQKPIKSTTAALNDPDTESIAHLQDTSLHRDTTKMATLQTPQMMMTTPFSSSTLKTTTLHSSTPRVTKTLRTTTLHSSTSRVTKKLRTTLKITTTTTLVATTPKTTASVTKYRCPLKNGNGHCIFPFHYKGKIYFTCTKQNYNAYWCGKVYSTTNRVWGYCSDECPRD